MNILMVSSECVPFVKTGGLADVVGTLPKYLKKNGHDVRIIIPKYSVIDGVKYNLKTLPYRLAVRLGKEEIYFRIKQGFLDENIPVYFIENMRFFDRSGVYGDDNGIGYGDNRERYIFFCKAVIESIKAILFVPDIIHCNDWHTGLIPAYLKITNAYDGFFWKTSVIYTIHNIAFQGSFDAATSVPLAGFSWEDYKSDKLEFYNTFNFMKAGIVYTDIVSTVSPTYAKEIQAGFGNGMEVVLKTRKSDIYGILNGIDYSYWNPETDNNLVANYSKQNIENKILCRKDLIEICNFENGNNSFVLSCVSRFDNQKGFDLIIDAINRIQNTNIKFVILGSGDRYIRDTLLYLQNKYPETVKIFNKYDENLAHKIYAGSDAFLMPSRFEPCGLSQLISLAYGTIPIVNKTGGLADTICDFDKSKIPNGFVFDLYSGESFVEKIKYAYKIFNDKTAWKILQNNAIKCSFTWDKSVKEYEKIYNIALKRKINSTIYR